MKTTYDIININIIPAIKAVRSGQISNRLSPSGNGFGIILIIVSYETGPNTLIVGFIITLEAVV